MLNRSISALMLILLTGALCSCSGLKIRDRDGSVHHLIIGFGLVTVPHNAGNCGVLATKAQSLGIHVSDQPGLKFSVGYGSSSTVAVPETTENIVVEVSQRPFGPLIVELNPHRKGENNAP
ncbi:MAG: hypothetical protein HXY46_05395 [Syntrophaceae bacterium]|nr:hypothetical protein [Syntrophaceae bacterium]